MPELVQVHQVTAVQVLSVPSHARIPSAAADEMHVTVRTAQIGGAAQHGDITANAGRLTIECMISSSCAETTVQAQYAQNPHTRTVHGQGMHHRRA